MTELSIYFESLQDCKSKLAELKESLQDLKNQCFKKWGCIPDSEIQEINGISKEIKLVENDIKFYLGKISEVEKYYA